MKIGLSNDSQCMLNLGENFGEEKEILHGFKCLPMDCLLVAKEKYYTVETRQHLDQVL